MVRTEAGSRVSSDGVGFSWISMPDLFSRGPEISRSKMKLDLQLGVEASSRVVLQKGQVNWSIGLAKITVVPGFRVLGFSALPGFRALKAGDGAWSVHKTLFGFKAPILGS